MATKKATKRVNSDKRVYVLLVETTSKSTFYVYETRADGIDARNAKLLRKNVKQARLFPAQLGASNTKRR